MDKDKQLKIILGAVILIFAVMALAAVFRPHRKPAVAPEKAFAQPVAQKVEASRERRTSSFSEWGRDPFTVGTNAIDLSGDLVLSGIVWDSRKPYCIINEKVVKIGDEISGYKVVEIKKDSVSVQAGDQIRVLKVGRQH